jgi:hypothetical protein
MDLNLVTNSCASHSLHVSQAVALEKAKTEGLLSSSSQRLHEVQSQVADLQAQVGG